MATRSGSLDPGLVLWLEEHAGMPPAELASTLEHRSGLLGLAGDADMRAVLDAASGRRRGRRSSALDVYLHRLRAGIAAMAAAMDGLDVLVFTGGVGEHAAPIRARAVAGLSFLGLALDLEANRRPGARRRHHRGALPREDVRDRGARGPADRAGRAPRPGLLEVGPASQHDVLAREGHLRG